jgi:hypothetical protein
MANEKRLIDANSLWLIFAEKAEKIELCVKDERKRVVSKLLIHWCMDELAGAPTVDAEPVVHGHWVKYNFLGYDQFACSECQTLGSPQWKRCPVCEAKMDGEDINEERNKEESES